MRRFIQWEYWQHPLGGGNEYVPEAEAKVPDHEWSEDEGLTRKMPPIRPVIPTPGGFIPATIYGMNNFFQNFNFWMMHTSFPITRRIRRIMDYHPGVETFDIVTNLRARVGFGRCFDPEHVKRSIEEVLKAPRLVKTSEPEMKLDPLTQEKLRIAEQNMRGNHPYWLIYVVPNGEVISRFTNKGSDYENHLDLLRQTKSIAGGILHTSHD